MSSNTYRLIREAVPFSHPSALRLIWPRAGALLGQTVLLAFLHGSPEQPSPPLLLLLAACVAMAAAACMLSLLRVRRQESLTDPAFFSQILTDVAVLTYMLAISGGPANPFHDVYFLPIAVAAASLPASLAWWVVAASLGGYTLVEFVYLPLPGSPADIARALGSGEWITHAFLVSLAAYFLLRVTRNLREHQRQLGEAHDSTARAERAVAVGSIAAGAAHELGTPLTTITTVVQELRAQQGDHPDLGRSLELLEGSVAECRKALEVLRQSDRCWSPVQQEVPIKTVFDHVLTRFRGMCPGSPVTAQIGSPYPEPVIVPDLSFQQAVINLLSNAAAVSPRHVELEVAWNASDLTVRVSDRGPGIASEVAAQLGRDFVSTKPGGCGVGLFLTRVTAQRLGGRFHIRNATHRGAVAEIVVPIASLRSRGK